MARRKKAAVAARSAHKDVQETEAIENRDIVHEKESVKKEIQNDVESESTLDSSSSGSDSEEATVVDDEDVDEEEDEMEGGDHTITLEEGNWSKTNVHMPHKLYMKKIETPQKIQYIKETKQSCLPEVITTSKQRTEVKVTKDNYIAVLSYLSDLLSRRRENLSFIAMDAEFTGLGPNPSEGRNQNLTERFKYLKSVVKSHALLTMGFSFFFKRDSTKEETQFDEEYYESTNDTNKPNFSNQFIVKNFTLLLNKEGEVTFSSNTGAFLAGNGFDFNETFSKGISFRSGNDMEIPHYSTGSKILRSFIENIMQTKKPFVVHNGLMDLMYLYQSFYAIIPDSITQFAADLNEMFPGGIYDTKHIISSQTKESISFLAYLFKKCERYQQRIAVAHALREFDSNNRDRYSEKFSLPKYISCHIDSFCPYEETQIETTSKQDLDFIRKVQNQLKRNEISDIESDIEEFEKDEQVVVEEKESSSSSDSSSDVSSDSSDDVTLATFMTPTASAQVSDSEKERRKLNKKEEKRKEKAQKKAQDKIKKEFIRKTLEAKKKMMEEKKQQEIARKEAKKVEDKELEENAYCIQFARHGHCPHLKKDPGGNSLQTQKGVSHDLGFILDQQYGALPLPDFNHISDIVKDENEDTKSTRVSTRISKRRREAEEKEDEELVELESESEESVSSEESDDAPKRRKTRSKRRKVHSSSDEEKKLSIKKHKKKLDDIFSDDEEAEGSSSEESTDLGNSYGEDESEESEEDSEEGSAMEDNDVSSSSGFSDDYGSDEDQQSVVTEEEEKGEATGVLSDVSDNLDTDEEHDFVLGTQADDEEDEEEDSDYTGESNSKKSKTPEKCSCRKVVSKCRHHRDDPASIKIVFETPHSAAYDAFMTGYVFAVLRQAKSVVLPMFQEWEHTKGNIRKVDTKESIRRMFNIKDEMFQQMNKMIEFLPNPIQATAQQDEEQTSTMVTNSSRHRPWTQLMQRNKMYLMSKPLPLLIAPSRFTKCSPAHRAKAGRIHPHLANKK